MGAFGQFEYVSTAIDRTVVLLLGKAQEFARRSTAREQPFGRSAAWFGSADEESDALSVQEHFERPLNRRRWTYQAADHLQ